jgi:hypothetical protein
MRTPRSAAAIFGGLALACAVAAPVQAQRTYPTLRVGQSLQGTLSESDPQLYERGHFKVYQFRAQPGVRYVVTMHSEEFDAYLTLARTVGGITDHMMFDDDGGSEPLAARLRFQVPEAGTYLLIAQALVEDGAGPFTIALDTVTIRQPTPGDIRVGQTVNAELTEDDAEYDIEGEDISGWYDLYRFQAREGQRLRITVQFEDYIPNIAVGTMEDGVFQMLEEDTGAGGSLMFTVPATGDYVLQVGAYGSVTGEYTVSMQERAPAQQARTAPVRRGQSVTGTLNAEDPELDDGRWYDAYAYTGRAGEELRITMSSEDFDTYLIIGRMVDGEFEELETNDDGEEGSGTNSVLEIELPEDGRYVIYATSFLEGTEGEYSLSVGARQ